MTLIIPSTLEAVARLVLAAVLGAVIGMQREAIRSPAGLRTHTLVSTGSALFTLMSAYMDWWGGTFHDPSKIAASVVSGVGFLGAGTILRSGSGIRGLTTAASLWSVAGIGMAAGAGYYSGALVTTVLVYCCLAFLRKAENKMDSGKAEKHLRVWCQTRETASKLPEILTGSGFEVRESSARMEKDHLEVRFLIGISKQTDYHSLLMNFQEAGVSNYEWREEN